MNQAVLLFTKEALTKSAIVELRACLQSQDWQTQTPVWLNYLNGRLYQGGDRKVDAELDSHCISGVGLSVSFMLLHMARVYEEEWESAQFVQPCAGTD